jgi:hypothetical protein
MSLYCVMHGKGDVKGLATFRRVAVAAVEKGGSEMGEKGVHAYAAGKLDEIRENYCVSIGPPLNERRSFGVIQHSEKLREERGKGFVIFRHGGVCR